MPDQMARSIRRRALPIAATLAALFVCRPGPAQFTGDPFDPYRAAYRSSSIPSYSSVGPLSSSYRLATPPGLGVVPGFGGFTRTDSPFSSLGAEFAPFYGIGRGRDAIGPVAPYYSAFRQYDQQFDRIYRPNTFGPGGAVDEEYYEDLRERQQLYIRAMDTSDPAERAELLREYRQRSERASLGISRRGRGPRAGAASDRRGATESVERPGPAEATPSESVGAIVRDYRDLLLFARAVDLAALGESTEGTAPDAGEADDPSPAERSPSP